MVPPATASWGVRDDRPPCLTDDYSTLPTHLVGVPLDPYGTRHDQPLPATASVRTAEVYLGVLLVALQACRLRFPAWRLPGRCPAVTIHHIEEPQGECHHGT